MKTITKEVGFRMEKTNLASTFWTAQGKAMEVRSKVSGYIWRLIGEEK